MNTTIHWIQSFLTHRPAADELLLVALIVAVPLVLWALYRGVRS